MLASVCLICAAPALALIVDPYHSAWLDLVWPGRYSARLLGIDTITSGAWVGKYGSQGVVLFNYTAVAQRDVASGSAGACSTLAGDHSCLPLPFTLHRGLSSPPPSQPLPPPPPLGCRSCSCWGPNTHEPTLPSALLLHVAYMRKLRPTMCNSGRLCADFAWRCSNGGLCAPARLCQRRLGTHI